jgi:ribokinase
VDISSYAANPSRSNYPLDQTLLLHKPGITVDLQIGVGESQPYRQMSSLPAFSSLNVVVVGSYNADLVLSCDPIPTLGESILAAEFNLYSGGRGANSAVAAARAGCQVAFVGAHGADLFGRMAREKLMRENINISHFVELSSPQTGVALVMVEAPTGKYMIAVAKSANSEISVELVRDASEAIDAADLVFTQFEISPEAVSETARLCSQYKKRLVLYASPAGPWSRLPESETFLTVLSIREALALAETRDVSYAIHWLHDRGSPNLVLVDGDQSITFSNEKGSCTVPIPRVRRVLYSASVECLVSWTAITLLATGDLARSVEIGAKAMAISLSREGAQESAPYRSEVLGTE